MEEKFLAQNIARLRKQNGLTQQRLAQKLHVSSQSVSKWELGESMPTLDLLIGLAQIFNVTLDELVINNDEFFKQVFNLRFCIESCSMVANHILRKVRYSSKFPETFTRKYNLNKQELLKLPETEIYNKICEAVKQNRDLQLLDDYANFIWQVWAQYKDQINMAFSKILGSTAKCNQLMCVVTECVNMGVYNHHIEVCPEFKNNNNGFSKTYCINNLVHCLLKKLICDETDYVSDVDKLPVSINSFLDVIYSVVIENSDLKPFSKIRDYTNEQKLKARAELVELIKPIYLKSYNLREFIYSALNFAKLNKQKFDEYETIK